MCRCGVTHMGVGATMLIPPTKTNGGFNCCATTTYFDGSNDDMRRTSTMGGISASRRGLIAFDLGWVNSIPTSRTLFSISTNGLNASTVVGFDASSRLTMTVTDGSPTSIFSFRTNVAFNLVSVPFSFFRFLVSWDTDFSAGNKIGKIWNSITGSDTVITSDAAAAFTIPYNQSRTTFHIGATVSGPRLEGVHTNFLFAPGVYQDVHDPTVQEYYFTPDETPVCEWFTSNNGGWACGSQPAIYWRDKFDSFQNNYGYGGAFTVTGALTGERSPCDTLLGDGGGVIIPD